MSTTHSHNAGNLPRFGLLNLDADGNVHLALFDPTAPSALEQAEAPVVFRSGPSPSSQTCIDDLFALAKDNHLAQLWVHPRWATAAGLPERLPRSAAGFLPRDEQGNVLYEVVHPFAEHAPTSTWSLAPAGKLSWWLHGFEPGIYGAIDVVFPQYNEQRGQWPWVHDEDDLTKTGMPDDSVVFLLALRYLTHALGMAIRRSPGSVGTRLMRRIHDRSDARSLSLEVPIGLPEPAKIGGVELELTWRRLLTEVERSRRWVHAYDKNAQFLGATSSLPLGFGEPIPLQSTSSWEILPYRKHPGYWRTSLSANPDLLLPDPISPYKEPTEQPEGIWLSSPTLDLAIELGRVRAVHEAYVWPTSHRALEPWYKRLRDARVALKTDVHRYPHAEAHQLAYQAVKAVYTQAIGWLSSTTWDREGDDLWRPDWRDAIIGQARANLFRNILTFVKSDHIPWMAGADCLYFLSDDPDPLTAKPEKMSIGDTLRDYKVKDAAIPLEELLPLIDDPTQSVNSLQAYLNRRRKTHAA